MHVYDDLTAWHNAIGTYTTGPVVFDPLPHVKPYQEHGCDDDIQPSLCTHVVPLVATYKSSRADLSAMSQPALGVEQLMTHVDVHADEFAGNNAVSPVGTVPDNWLLPKRRLPELCDLNHARQNCNVPVKYLPTPRPALPAHQP